MATFDNDNDNGDRSKVAVQAAVTERPEIVLLPLDVTTVPTRNMRIVFAADLPDSGVTYAACEFVAAVGGGGGSSSSSSSSSSDDRGFKRVRVLGVRSDDDTPSRAFGTDAVTHLQDDVSVRRCVQWADAVIVDRVTSEFRSAVWRAATNRTVAVIAMCTNLARDLTPQMRGDLDLAFERDSGPSPAQISRDISVRARWPDMMRAVTFKSYRYLVTCAWLHPVYRHHRAPSRVAAASRLLGRSAFSQESGSVSVRTAPCLTRIPTAISACVANVSWLPDAVALFSATRVFYAIGTAYLANTPPVHEYRERHPGNITVVTRCQVPSRLRPQ